MSNPRPPSPALAQALARPGTNRRKTLTGSCTRGCGLCCRVMAVPGAQTLDPASGRVRVKLPANPKPDWLHWLTVRGATFEGEYAYVPYRPDAPRPAWISFYGAVPGPVTYIANTCEQLTEDGDCRLHDTPAKPRMCVNYPLSDDALSVVPGCTYTIS